MKVLLGIIIVHILVIIRAKSSSPDHLPYLSILLLSFLLVAYVTWMMFSTESPQP